MNDSQVQFVGSIPEHYDAHLGPFFFEFYAGDTARRVDAPEGARVLETACGTGISTRALRAALPDSVKIIATDLNEPMIDYARGKVGEAANVEFRVADATDLPFEDSSFDTLVCQFGVMFLPDKAAGMREAARVLKPGGTFLFNVWDSFEFNTVARISHETVGRFFESDPPQFMRMPFGTYEIDPLKAMLIEAGFRDIDISVVPTVSQAPTARHFAIGMVKGNPTVHEVTERATASSEEVIDAVADAFREAFGDAPFRAPLQAILFTARLDG